MAGIIKTTSTKRDISKEIANETDPEKREELLKERQDYIDKNGLEGSVPSNELVSTWTKDYQPGNWSGEKQEYNKVYTPSSSGGSYGKSNSYSSGSNSSMIYSVEQMYKELEDMQSKALEDARERNKQALNDSLAEADGEFDTAATRAQTNARLTAIGNEEKLAVLGLSGGAYNDATSGYGESSRTMLDSALQSDINSIEQSRASTKSELREASNDIDYALTQDSIENMSKLALEKANTLYDFYKEDNAYELEKGKLIGVIDGKETMSKTEFDYGVSQDSYFNSYQENIDAYTSAMERWRVFGEVLESDANVLGIPAGTKTADKSYDEAKLYLDKLKIYN